MSLSLLEERNGSQAVPGDSLREDIDPCHPAPCSQVLSVKGWGQDPCMCIEWLASLKVSIWGVGSLWAATGAIANNLLQLQEARYSV